MNHALQSMNDCVESGSFRRQFTIFVGNLSFFCKEDNLLQLYKPIGRVVKVTVARNTDMANNSLLYGYVEFEDPVTATAAMNNTHGQLFMGRILRVFTLSSPPQTNVLHKPDEYYSVHVNFVTHDPKKIVHEEYLHKLFSEFGGIVDIAIRRYFRQHRRQYGYAFVDYYERSSANNAAAKLANVNIEGIRIQATVGHRSVDAVHDSGNMSANSSTTTRDSIDQQDHFKGSFEDSHFNQASETRSPVGIEQVHSQRRYDKSSASIMPPNNIILQTPPTFIGNAAKNESHHGHSGLTIFPPVPIFYPPPQLMQPVNMVNHQENPHHSQSYHSQSYYPQPPHTPFSNQTPAATGNKMISNNQTNFNHAVPVPYMYNVVPPSYDGYSAAPMHQTMYYAVGSNPDGTIVYFPIPAAPMYPTYSTINS